MPLLLAIWLLLEPIVEARMSPQDVEKIRKGLA